MAKAKKASKATKVNASKATVAKTADFKTAIVKEPKAVLQAIGMDFSVAYDKAKKRSFVGRNRACSFLRWNWTACTKTMQTSLFVGLRGT